MKERQHELSIEGNSAEIYGTIVNFKNLDMKACSFIETLRFGVSFEIEFEMSKTKLNKRLSESLAFFN